MTKESIIELQKIDCSCNDCGFMVRDLSRPPLKGTKAPISYGTCSKFNKEVTFIPGVCQLETQKCFVHRKDTIHKRIE
jgi:hypothetical protein